MIVNDKLAQSLFGDSDPIDKQILIDGKQFTELYVNPAFGMADFNAVPADWRSRIPEYVKDYVSLNPFM